MNIGDRVKVNMSDANGKDLYGTIIDANFLGIACLVSCDTKVDQRYCYTDSIDQGAMFLKTELKVIE